MANKRRCNCRLERFANSLGQHTHTEHRNTPTKFGKRVSAVPLLGTRLSLSRWKRPVAAGLAFISAASSKLTDDVAAELIIKPSKLLFLFGVYICQKAE